MIGNQADMVARLRAVLPARWFPDDAPILTGLLNGLASVWAWAYAALAFVRAQTRLATASGASLDLIAADLFGARVARGAGEADDALRARIGREIRRERATRAAVVSVLTDLTGRAPAIFEPARVTDTGGYGLAFAYGAAGGWGSLSLPFQVLVTAFWPVPAAPASVAGWGDPAGAYGVGAMEYAPATAGAAVTDAAIYDAVAAVMPAATIAWTRIAD